MYKTIKSIIPVRIKRFALRFVNKYAGNKAIKEWEKAGKPLPPPHIVKQRCVAEYARKYKTPVLVETGTFLGDMVQAQLKNFREIYSLELGGELAYKAQQKFEKYPHVHIIQGDSATLLPELLLKINGPALFWLDGHYSGGITAKGDKETPVIEELKAILTHSIKTHIILIDDARCFDGTHDYPTMDEIFNLVRSLNPNYICTVNDDIIRCMPE